MLEYRTIKPLAVPALLLLALLGRVAVWPSALEAVELPPAGHFTLWQLPLYFGMSYVIQSPTGHLAVIDGGSAPDGMNQDAAYLKEFLRARGGHVDDWFISHCHSDHVDVLTYILSSPDLRGLKIDSIYASLVSEPWLQQHDRTGMLPTTRAFKAALAARDKSVIRPTLGQEIVLDGVNFQVLTLADENIFTNSNDQSMVIRLTTTGTSILFLGDLEEEGGKRLLASKLADRLRSEYVQMAHHGNWGVGREFYAAVKAKYALWPTPGWLWDVPADHPRRFTTPKYRQWMRELGVEKNYVMKDGLIRLDLPMKKPASAPSRDP
jgi:beta-lactamase superfamily II metal-dependent hydrolase